MFKNWFQIGTFKTEGTEFAGKRKHGLDSRIVFEGVVGDKKRNGDVGINLTEAQTLGVKDFMLGGCHSYSESDF